MSNADILNNLFGLDSDDLTGHALDVPDYPDTVPGRVLHIDGDFLAYQVSADDTKSVDTMMHNHDVAVETLRLLAGAESAVCHLTASHGDKGGRYDIAIQREYQVSRKGKEKPKQLHTIKSWMEHSRGAVNHVHQEADDGLCQALVNAPSPELAVLVSKDKDLQMCSGLHLDWDTGELELVDGFGYVELDRSKSTPKIVGKGTAYFWAQMLTGDGADSIQGLPKLPGSTMNALKPTKAIQKALDTLQDSTATSKQFEKAQKTLAERKPAACGPVIAWEILKKLKTDKQAYTVLKTLYKKYGEEVGYTHWKTGEPAKWQDVFISEAKLLWMRRAPDEDDVIKFFKECNA